MKIGALIVAALAVTAWSGLARADTVSLTVNTDKVLRQINADIYGQFLEHINHSVNGGLWGEVVWNRSFEETTFGGRGGSRRGLQPTTTSAMASTVTTGPAPLPVAIPRWSAVGGAAASLDTNQPLNGLRSVKIVASAAGGGLMQTNFCLRRGDALKGSLWLRGNAADGFLVRLVDQNDKAVFAEQAISAPPASWTEFPLALIPRENADSANLEILTRGPAEVWLDQVSLMPDSARAIGGFRPDLLHAIADLKPTTIRWPGGGFAANYHWKNGIGPESKRIGKGGPSDIDPLGLGLDEFMTLCHMVGAQPVVCVPLGPRDNSQLAQFVQDAVDELEYCNSAAGTTWGKARAANGHPEPYHVKYWEIDNELYLTNMPPRLYLESVAAFSSALKKKDPTISILACGGGGTTMETDHQWQLRMLEADLKPWDFSSIHEYENYGRGGILAPDDTSRFRTGVVEFEKHFADYRDRIAKSSNPQLKVYVSEWNYMSTDWRTGLYAGGLLNVMERNSDIVPMACPALFLRHVSSTSWDNALINFDNRTWYPAPNYVVMKLYRERFQPNLLGVIGDPGNLDVTATKSDDGKHLVLKVVNAADRPMDVTFNLQGNFKPVIAKMSLVTADTLTARNTLDKPDVIKPAGQALTPVGRSLRTSLPRWSVGVLDLDE